MTTKLSPRQLARQYAVKGLYQWAINHTKPEVIVAFQAESAKIEGDAVDEAYLADLLQGAIKDRSSLDEGLSMGLDRDIKEVDPVELSILRLAAYEMKHELSVPYRVILNEAIELAKCFSGAKSYQFINGVLDKSGRGWRPTLD